MSDMCTICGEPLDEVNVSHCSFCGRSFHMTWNTDTPVKNCGQIWFDPRFSGMGFACSICAEENPWIKDMTIKFERPPG